MDLSTFDAQRTACTFCPKLCRHVCPAAEAEKSEVATPTFKQQVALLASTGRIPLDAERAEVVYKCTDCQATEPVCRHRIDPAPSLRDARALAVRTGVAPAVVGKVAERFAARGSPYDLDLGARLDAALPGERARATATPLGPDTVRILPLCTSLAHDPSGLGRSLAALRAAGVDARVALPELPCCGYPLDTLGHQDAFRTHVARVLADLEGPGTIAAQGPACVHALVTRAHEVGLRPRLNVVPLVDLLARHARPAAAADRPLRYAYHDPCNLGRRLRRVEEPRALILALTGAAPVELPGAAESSPCSGAGGGYPLTNPVPAATCATNVLEAFRATGADVLVTGCPSARRHFSKADPTARVVGLEDLLPAVAVPV